MNVSSVVWHYTNGEGLKGILSGKQLWASSAAFMNDANELQSGLIQLKEYITAMDSSGEGPIFPISELDLINERRHDRYILSASADGDNLTMWRYYGRDTVSYAIGIDTSKRLLPLAIEAGTYHPNPPPGHGLRINWDDLGHSLTLFDPDELVVDQSEWTSVIYDSTEQSDLVEEVYKSMANSARRDIAKSVESTKAWTNAFLADDRLSRIKNSGFKDESEIRTVLSARPEWKFVQHRPGPFGMVPFISLTGSDASSSEKYAKFRRDLPITEIRVGPTPYGAAARKSLAQYLGFLGMHHVPVSQSEIPFRQ